MPFQLGYDIDGKEFDDLFWSFKSVAEKKKVNWNSYTFTAINKVFIAFQVMSLPENEIIVQSECTLISYDPIDN